MKKLFTSESVGRGHPDKLCDQISDAILDEYLKLDPHSKVAIETMASGNNVVIAGEVASKVKVDVKEIAKNILKSLGYFNYDTNFFTDIKKQSPDIAQGVELGDEIGAGDQGIMFGFATNETKNYMPLAITLAHKIVEKAEELRNSRNLKWAYPDMKSQVTVDYTDEKNPKIETVLLSIQHDENYNEHDFHESLKNLVIYPVLKEYGFDSVNNIYINPTGKFVIGGPWGDTGLTGRKIIVDTYGGYAHHGGGAFSGKDATKVDRSAAYALRWIAKNLVAAGACDKVEIQIAYAIGRAKPVSIHIDTFGTEKYPIEKIYEAVDKLFDLTPKGIIQSLNLRKPIYAKTAYFGHFGRDNLSLPWEELNRVNEIQEFLNK
ncbi:methionine adenosyltransferase [Mycoplasmopsis pullorum]|uniref:methionine adenosyltransferase n=1 Tax=Mycoplasmopsis pullorum TaxID=48003 RepID=UPI00111B8C58|nr:methionine adenosyltransferase [Mycoplasmopsis pullorum]TNK82591.1 methionine adenosyltransferase [Mycoplasmopsis pullorum]TNK83490.1 methionine adenosyltransferase [Mycoplasmopsis pullorum]TNK84713.1 methionine adenosyltransferase [Mycoplasmopsis pullorum]TNK85744.1 methionine adenosyltransferase [Mycoplasmopsis pullorum]TNK86285.1 methionine adenosyltransferase [Mycoplasmopsis pullorum]